MVTRPPPRSSESAPQGAASPRADAAANTPTIPVATDQGNRQPDGVSEVYEDEEDLYEEEYLDEGRSVWRFLVGFGSCGFSLVFHLVGLLLLAYLTVPESTDAMNTMLEAVFDPRVEDEPVEFELDPEITTVTETSLTSISARPMVGVGSGVEGTVGLPQLDAKVLKEAADSASVDDIQIESPLAGAPSFERLVEAVPDGEFKGDPRAIIDNYEQAMDRIAQELLWMMDKGPVLAIWAFDQSGSMKDDQQEIRERINNVYLQLGLTHPERRKRLATSVVSYGANYMLHTRPPTSDLDEIRAAINQVPEDPSGKEMMCQAVGRAIMDHREYARAQGAQMALILVTDESGEKEDNWQYLEQAVAEAKAAKCKVYVLGREAVFGYPFVYMRWQHPQTHEIHWLPVNRGPETAFVEQLQVDGFRRRHDAFPSGFGPYEQCRLARETGGIFFMLPSLESALVRGEKRHYELEVMRPYRADLRARVEALADRESNPLRSVIWQCIYELNPIERPEIASQVEMRVHFSPNYEEFVRQANVEGVKAKNYLTYLARVQKILEDGARYRTEEADPRWQANYDLIYAQLVAYQARIWEYGAALEAFVREPEVVPMTKPPNRHLVHWNVHVRKETRTQESLPYIEKARQLFNVVIENHPGTPWAARAQNELQRGFGVDFRPEYRQPYYNPPGGITVAIPKL